MLASGNADERKEAGLQLAELVVERERLLRLRTGLSRARFNEPIVLVGFVFIIGFFAPAVLAAGIWVAMGKTTAILRHWQFRILLSATVLAATYFALRIVVPLRAKRLARSAEIDAELREVDRQIAEISPS